MLQTHTKSGFMLVEAITAVALVSICLTLIIQALLTNLRAGAQFQQKTRAIFAAENQLGVVFASEGFQDTLPGTPQTLEEPYQQLTVQARVEEDDDRVKKVELTFNNLKGKPDLNVSTIVYHAGQTKSGTFGSP